MEEEGEKMRRWKGGREEEEIEKEGEKMRRCKGGREEERSL